MGWSYTYIGDGENGPKYNSVWEEDTPVYRDTHDEGYVYPETPGYTYEDPAPDTQTNYTDLPEYDTRTVEDYIAAFGKSALDSLKARYTTSSGVNWGNIIKDAATGIGAYKAYQAAQQPQIPTGYQGGIPERTAVRSQVPTTPGVRPGAGGQRYFTDVQYADAAGLPAAQAAVEAQKTALATDNNYAARRGFVLQNYTDMGRTGATAPTQSEVEWWAKHPDIQNETNSALRNRMMQAATTYADQPMYAGNAEKARVALSPQLQKEQADQFFGRSPTVHTMAQGGEVGLTGGAFVLPADVVSHLGNGNSNSGAAALQRLLGDVQYLNGDTDGMADRIPANIDGQQRAAVAHGEVIVPPATVARMGGGDIDKGTQSLYAMMDAVRKQRTGNPKQGKQIDAEKTVMAAAGGGLQSLASGGGVKKFAGTTTSSVPSATAINAGLTGTESSLSNWVGPYVTDMLADGKALAEMPYEAYAGPLTAGDSDLQTLAYQNATNLATPTSIGDAATSANTIGTLMGNLSYNPDNFSSAYTAPLATGYTAEDATAASATAADKATAEDAVASLATAVPNAQATNATAASATAAANAVASNATAPTMSAAPTSTYANAGNANYAGSQGYNAMSTGAAATNAATLGMAPTSSAASMGPAALAKSQGYDAATSQAANLAAAPTASAANAGIAALAGSQGYDAAKAKAVDTQAARLSAAPTMDAAGFSGPGAVSAERVSAPQLREMSMQAATGQYDPSANLTNYQMGSVGDVTTQDFRTPGTASSFMSPYIQNVIDTQTREAQRAADVASTQRQSEQTQRGAYGGSRAAIMDAEAARNLATQKGDITARGLQSAYEQAQSQFNTQQQAGLTAQQANQQAGLTVGRENLGANLNVQGLGANIGSQYGLASLANRQQANLQNLSAGLQVQELQAQTGMQAQTSNQSAGLQAGMANQGMEYNTAAQNAQMQQQARAANQSLAGQYGLTQAQLQQQALGQTSSQAQQTALANAGYNNQASQYGAQAGNQASLANQSAANQMAQYNAGLGQQATLANQALAGQYGLTQGQFSQQSSLANQAAYNQASQFGAQASNQESLANQAALNQTGQYNAGLQQQTGLANQALAGQYGLTQGQFSQQALGQTSAQAQQSLLANQNAYNQASQFGSQAWNQASLANSGYANQMAQYNAGLQQQTGLANQALAGQYGLTQAQLQSQAALQNAQLGTQTSLANQTTANNMSQYNAGLSQQTALQNAQLGTQTSLANQTAGNQMAQYNAGLSQQAALQNSQLGTQVSLANQTAGNNMAQYNAGLEQQTALANQQAGNQALQFGATQDMTSAGLAAQYGLAADQLNQAGNQFDANFGLQALQGQLGATNTSGQLGVAQNAAGLANLNTQLHAGATQQATTQAGVTADINAFNQERANPYNMLTYQQSLLQGLPLAAQSYNMAPVDPYQAAIQGAAGITGLLK